MKQVQNKIFLFLSIFFLFVNLVHADPKEDAVKIVQETIAFAKANSSNATIAAVNQGKFTKGELYVFIGDLEGKTLAHGTKPGRAGQNMINDKDPDGKLFVKERIEMIKANSKGWKTYKFQNPVTKKIENKEVYSELYEGLIYSAGSYVK